MIKEIFHTTIYLIILSVFFPFVVCANADQMLDQALPLFKQKNYLASLSILESIEKKSDVVIYWLWKNEKEIARLAEPTSIDENNKNHKYYQYIKTHPESFYHSEPRGYIPTSRRYREIIRLVPESDYAGSILLGLIESDYYERSDGGMNQEDYISLISQYQGFLNQYPKHPKVQNTKNELDFFEERVMEILNETFEGGFLATPILYMYTKRFTIDGEAVKEYVKEWLESGQYREFDIEVRPGKRGNIKKDSLKAYDVPVDIKKNLHKSLSHGKLVVFSVAAFKSKKWKGPKFLFFDPKIN